MPSCILIILNSNCFTCCTGDINVNYFIMTAQIGENIGQYKEITNQIWLSSLPIFQHKVGLIEAIFRELIQTFNCQQKASVFLLEVTGRWLMTKPWLEAPATSSSFLTLIPTWVSSKRWQLKNWAIFVSFYQWCKKTILETSNQPVMPTVKRPPITMTIPNHCMHLICLWSKNLANTAVNTITEPRSIWKQQRIKDFQNQLKSSFNWLKRLLKHPITW